MVEQSNAARESRRIVAALGALAHEARLAAYRALVEAGPDGLPAGALAERLAMPPSSLSFHLQALLHAGLVSQRRVGRQLLYAMVPAAMNGLITYLSENCCGGLADCRPACQPGAVEAPSSKSA
jgi:DNA-binding transcriptional ArsR family regulator